MYPGGKAGAGVYQRIINLMPPHQVYIEAFLGGAAIMRHKRPARLNIGIDRDPHVIQTVKFLWPSIFGDGGRAAFQFAEADALEYLAAYPWTGQEMVYCDPPYLMSTRSTRRRIYRHEMSEAEHRRLLEVLTTIKDHCMVMISGYWSKLYEAYLGRPPWHTTSYQAMTRGGQLATESLWFNYSKPATLHDYKHLGADFRARERIHRKITRWTARLRKLPVLERNAILAAIRDAARHTPAELFPPGDYADFRITAPPSAALDRSAEDRGPRRN